MLCVTPFRNLEAVVNAVFLHWLCASIDITRQRSVNFRQWACTAEVHVFMTQQRTCRPPPSRSSIIFQARSELGRAKQLGQAFTQCLSCTRIVAETQVTPNDVLQQPHARLFCQQQHLFAEHIRIISQNRTQASPLTKPYKTAHKQTPDSLT